MSQAVAVMSSSDALPRTRPWLGVRRVLTGVIALVLIASAVGKLASPVASAQAAKLPVGVLFALAGIEAVTALGLLFGKSALLAQVCAVFLFGSFLSFHLRQFYTAPAVKSCGCFGSTALADRLFGNVGPGSWVLILIALTTAALVLHLLTLSARRPGASLAPVR